MSTDCSAEFTESLNNRVSNKTLITLPRRYRDHPDDFPVAARPEVFYSSCTTAIHHQLHFLIYSRMMRHTLYPFIATRKGFFFVFFWRETS